MEGKYNDLQPGHPDNPKPWSICGAKRRNGETCHNRAGYKTSHVGAGRCFVHGGRSLSGPASPNYKHGRYMTGVLHGSLAGIYNQVSAARSDNPLELWEELNTQRTLLVVALMRLQGVDAFDNYTYLKHEEEEGVIDLSVPSGKVGVGGVGVIGGGKVSSLSAPSPASTKGMSRNQKRKAGLIEITRKDGGEVYANETKREKKSAIQPLGGGMVAVEEGQLQIVRDLINDIVGTTQKIGAMINQDRMTSAEMVFIAAALKEIVNEFVAPDKQAAFINRLRERIPAIVGRTEKGGSE